MYANKLRYVTTHIDLSGKTNIRNQISISFSTFCSFSSLFTHILTWNKDLNVYNLQCIAILFQFLVIHRLIFYDPKLECSYSACVTSAFAFGLNKIKRVTWCIWKIHTLKFDHFYILLFAFEVQMHMGKVMFSR